MFRKEETVSHSMQCMNRVIYFVLNGLNRVTAVEKTIEYAKNVFMVQLFVVQ